MTTGAIAPACACACVIAAGLAACGDDRAAADVLDARSGSRIAMGWYGYDDGARQSDGSWLYDRTEHVRCTQQLWADGEMRCVPVADRALYRDAECTDAIGEVSSIMKPTHFVAYDFAGRGGLTVAAHVYHAGGAASRPTDLYELIEGACVGPFGSTATSYFNVIGEVDGAALVAFHPEQVGDGRIAIRMDVGSDGTRLRTGLYDRERDEDCSVSRKDDGTAECAPDDATDTNLFHDPECTQALVAVGELMPSAVRVTDAGGCQRIHSVAGATGGPVYARVGGACVQTSIDPGLHLYEVGPELDLAPLSIEPEAVAGRRLQQVVIDSGESRWYAASMIDTATGETCRPVTLDNSVSWRCLPEPLFTVKLVSTSSQCRGEVPVTEVPRRGCQRSAFAVGFSDHYEVHAIGDPVAGSLFDGSTGGCIPYAAPAGTVGYFVGPEVDPKTFVRALHYGER